MGLAYPSGWIANEVVQNLWRVRECRLGRDAEISHVAARLPIRVINQDCRQIDSQPRMPLLIPWNIVMSTTGLDRLRPLPRHSGKAREFGYLHVPIPIYVPSNATTSL